MWPIICPETSVRNYQSTLRKIPDECRSHLDGGGNLTTRKFLLISMILNLLAFRLLHEITSRFVNETLGHNPTCTNPTQPSVWHNFLLWNFTRRASIWVIFLRYLNEWCVFINTEIPCLNECCVVKTMHRDLPSVPNLWTEQGGPLLNVQCHTNLQLHVI